MDTDAAGSLPEGSDQKRGLRCSRCKTGGQCTDLIFEHDWQGELWCVCLVCWAREQRGWHKDDPRPVVPTDEETAAFWKLRKASWRRRSNSSKAILRHEKLHEALAETKREPDESVRAWRRRAVSTVGSLVARFMASFEALSPEDQNDIEAAFTKWHQIHEAIEKDPATQVEMNYCGTVLPAEALDMASSLIKGISEFYICRLLRQEWSRGEPPAGLPAKAAPWVETTHQCGFFAPSSCWAATDPSFNGGHYRRPACGTLYQPWVDMPGKRTGFNKLLVVEQNDKDTADFWRTQLGNEKLEPVAETSTGESLVFIPFWWASTAEQGLGDRLKEVALQVGKSLENVPTHELPMRIAQLALSDQISKVWWTPGTITGEAMEQIEKVNTSSSRDFYHTAHLQKPFLQARYEHKPETKVWNQDDLAKAYSLMHVAIREARAEAARQASRAASRRGRG